MSGDLFETTKFEDFFSESTLALTFEKTITNHRTRGVDGETPEMFSKNKQKNFERISKSVLVGGYKFTRYKEKLILKGARQIPREVYIPTVCDRLVLRCLHDYLALQFPASHTPLPHSCIKAIKTRLKTADQSNCFVRVDIKNFYPSIWHGKLMLEIKKVIKDQKCLSLLKSAISTTNKKGQLSKRGVPQGLSISNRLANIMLSNADQGFVAKFGVENYFRYVDDIVLITNKSTSASDFSDISSVLKKAGLAVHNLSANGAVKSKSKICSMTDGVEYLGFEIKLDGVSVRKASLKRMYDRIAGLITGLKYGRATARVAFKLDLMISGCILKGKRFGWLHFFQQTDDISQLVNLDNFVKRLLGDGKRFPKNFNPKTFVKAYHEIRFNSDSTKYIPNFDESSLVFKKSTLMKFANLPNIDQWTIEEINEKFFSLVSKMARELEQDILEPTS